MTMAGLGRRTLATGLAGLVVASVAGCGSPVDRSPSARPAPPAASGQQADSPAELTTGPLMASIAPDVISIPKLGVSSRLVGLGTDPDGAMQVPTDAVTIGWFTGAPPPGALGPAVLAGHVDWKGSPGAFAHLGTLVVGDTVTVTRLDGSRAEFSVTAVQRHPKDRFPTDAVYGAIDHAGLRLITCGGDFDRRTGHYVDNIVVFAKLQRALQPGA